MAAVSEVFVAVTAYQIAYLQAPDYEEKPCKIQNVGSFPFVHFLTFARPTGICSQVIQFPHQKMAKIIINLIIIIRKNFLKSKSLLSVAFGDGQGGEVDGVDFFGIANIWRLLSTTAVFSFMSNAILFNWLFKEIGLHLTCFFPMIAKMNYIRISCF